MSNNTTGFPNLSKGGAFSPQIGITIIILSGFPIFVNLLYIVLCARTLKDELHNFLVLCLCVCDMCFSVSLCVFTASKFIAPTNLVSCLISFTMLAIGMISTYGMIILISLERYLTVKFLNFGVKEKMHRMKYRLISGTFTGTILTGILVVNLVPHSSSIQECDIALFYGQNFKLIAVLLSTLGTILLLIVVVFTCMTSFHIWMIFFRNRQVHPIVSNYKDPSVCIPSTSVNVGNCLSYSNDKQSISMADINTNKWVQNRKYKHSDKQGKMINTLQQIKEQESDHMFESEDVITMETNLGEHMKNVEDSAEVGTDIEDITRDIINNKKNASDSNKSNHQIKQLFKTPTTEKAKYDASWEVRAFTTNIIIVTTTILFTGPLFGSLMYEALADTLVPSTIRMSILSLFTINGIINPFIYAWRIAEIRENLRKFFRRN